MIDQLSIGRVIHRLDAYERLPDVRQMLVEVVHEVLLSLRRADQKPLLGAADGVDDVIEEAEVEGGMTCADDARLMVHFPERAVGLDVLALYIVGVETEHVGFLAVHPDDGVTVGQWFLPMAI